MRSCRRSHRPPCSLLRPDLILLDLNLPGIDGRLVLRALKADARLRNIPVLVLSASDNPQDIATAHDLGATSYIIKPPSYAEYEQMMKVVDLYWFSVVARPAKR
jgi:two-component system, response regulator